MSDGRNAAGQDQWIEIYVSGAAGIPRFQRSRVGFPHPPAPDPSGHATLGVVGPIIGLPKSDDQVPLHGCLEELATAH